METRTKKETVHRHLYNALADEYKKRAVNTLTESDLIAKAQWLKAMSPWENVLEIGVGWGNMNKLLSDVGFKTTGIDIAEKMIENARALNPKGKFIVGDYAQMQTGEKYDAIAGLAFIHLFAPEEARNLLLKMYNDLADGGVLHLTTTKEDQYSYAAYNKQDYGENCHRFRAKHTPESFLNLLKSTPFKVEWLDIQDGAYGKQRMWLRARK